MLAARSAAFLKARRRPAAGRRPVGVALVRPCAAGVELLTHCSRSQRAQHARTAARGDSQAALVSPAVCVMAVAVCCASLKLLYHVTARYLKNERTPPT